MATFCLKLQIATLNVQHCFLYFQGKCMCALEYFVFVALDFLMLCIFQREKLETIEYTNYQVACCIHFRN